MHVASQLLPLFLAVVSVAPNWAADESKETAAFVPLLSNDEAWKRLPKPDKGGGQPLPAWALATAEALPGTTAAMLELDYLHRVDSPLPARLRGIMRWTAARANRCAYTQAQALADLRLARVDPVLNAIQTRHQQCGKRNVRVRRRIGRAILNAFGLGTR